MASMGLATTIVLCAVVCASSLEVSNLQRDLGMSLKERPVMKVVRMLQDMMAELQKELDDDKQVFETLSCWCKDNNKEKTKAIEMGQQLAEQLKASLSEAAAKVVELKAKRKETMDEIAADTKALKEATEIRFKENKAFHAEEVDLIEAVKACEQAVTVLSKHHPQLSQIKSVVHVLQTARVSDMILSTGLMGRAGARVLKDFLDKAQTASTFLAIPGFKGYAPQSGQIFGILRQMKHDFEGSLSRAQKTEAQAQAEYDSLKAAKEDQIASGQKTVVQIDTDLAALGEKAAAETKELDDTNAQLALDTEFLSNLEAKCKMTEEEYDARTKDRLEEIAAVQDTITILNSDESFDLFSKTTGAAVLLQTRSVSANARNAATEAARKKAVTILRRASIHTNSPILVFLAASAQLDTFTKVITEIDKLVVELSTQQKDEVAHRDECISSLNTNKRETEATYDKKSSLETKESDLKQEIVSLTEKISETEAASVETSKQMKRASETREAENADFQETIVDQQLTQQILKKALARMKEVYALLQQAQQDQDEDEQPGAPHIQTSGNHTDPGNGPARFTKYEKHAGGLRVVALLEKVIAESEKMENEALAAEQDAQSVYESFMKDSNKALKQYAMTKINLSESKAKAEAGLSMTKSDLSTTMKELEGLNTVLGDLKKSCDFLLKNFDARQEARAAEISALREAKAILKGMQ